MVKEPSVSVDAVYGVAVTRMSARIVEWMSQDTV